MVCFMCDRNGKFQFTETDTGLEVSVDVNVMEEANGEANGEAMVSTA